MENIKQERTEHVFVHVSKEVAEEFKMAADNKTLQEEIVRKYLTSEREWVKEELARIDEATIMYKARLIGIKDAFSKAQDSYVEEIESLFDKVNTANSKIDSSLKSSGDTLTRLSNTVSSIRESIDKIDLYKLERLMSILERFSQMSKEEKDVLITLLNRK